MCETEIKYFCSRSMRVDTKGKSEGKCDIYCINQSINQSVVKKKVFRSFRKRESLI